MPLAFGHPVRVAIPNSPFLLGVPTHDVIVGENITFRINNESRAGRGALSVLRNDVVKGGEEIPEGVAEPIGSQRADARSNVHADDGRLDFFDSAYNGCPPRLRDRIGSGK